MTLTSSVEPIRFISARSVLPSPCRLLSPAMYTSHVHAPLLLIGVSLLGRSSFRGRSRSAHSRGPALPARRCPGDRLPDDAAGNGETGRLPGVEAAHAQAAVAGHAARVAAVEHGDEAAVVRKLAVELDELLVADGVRGVPV